MGAPHRVEGYTTGRPPDVPLGRAVERAVGPLAVMDGQLIGVGAPGLMQLRRALVRDDRLRHFPTTSWERHMADTPWKAVFS